MASGTTTVHGLPYPLSTDAPSVHTDIQALANALDGTLLTPTGFATSQTLVAGRLAVSTVSPVTFTLPAPAANAVVGVFAKVASGTAPVTVSGSAIYGAGMSGVSSFVLGAPGAFVILRSDGINWYVTAGQQDTGWVSLTLATNVSVANGSTFNARLTGSQVRLSSALQTSVQINFGGTVFTVPASMKPTRPTIINPLKASGSSPSVPYPLGINTTTGAAGSEWSGDGAFAATGVELGLDGITYPID